MSTETIAPEKTPANLTQEEKSNLIKEALAGTFDKEPDEIVPVIEPPKINQAPVQTTPEPVTDDKSVVKTDQFSPAPEQTQEVNVIQKYNLLKTKIGKQGEEVGELRKKLQEQEAELSRYKQTQITPQQPFVSQTQQTVQDQSDDFDSIFTDKNSFSRAVQKEAKRIFDEEKIQRNAVDQITNEMVGFQLRHPEFKTKDHISNIDRIGASHSEWGKLQDLMQLYQYGSEKGIRNNIEASYLYLLHDNGTMEQMIKDAEKKGAAGVINALQVAGNSTKTLGQIQGTPKAPVSGLGEARNYTERRSVAKTMGTADLRAVLKDVIKEE